MVDSTNLPELCSSAAWRAPEHRRDAAAMKALGGWDDFEAADACWPTERGVGAASLGAHRRARKRADGPLPALVRFYGTYHAAKGLEFDAVIVPFVSSARLPHPPDVEAFGANDAATSNAKLLYVAVTRAKSDLVLTYTGAPSALVPADAGLLQRSSR